eukprot:TRINITY_DN12340_c0_g1_i1.p1 TRINITY_DN12340_c0_g1~~TRINITY_DN12340_c0_g1_i1.p1  ORF type:complete len:244 (-),score=48.67 TRINITY_DN12340_c0_g1_i1:94-825(-)
MIAETGCDGVMVARGATKSIGKVFDPSWQDDDETTVACVDEIEKRYFELAESFGGCRPKIAEYHQESFRRVRARGSKRVLRLQWEELNWWLMREHKQIEGGVPEEERSRYLETLFREDVRINFCNLSPEIDKQYHGREGVLQVLPLLAELVVGRKLDVHLPSEEAELDTQQIVIGMDNTCTLHLLFSEDSRIARLSVSCAACKCNSRLPVKAEIAMVGSKQEGSLLSEQKSALPTHLLTEVAT